METELIERATHFLTTQGFSDLYPSRTVRLDAGDPMNVFADGDVWLLFFDPIIPDEVPLEPVGVTVVFDTTTESFRVIPAL